jgi:hypothetical protein
MNTSRLLENNDFESDLFYRDVEVESVAEREKESGKEENENAIIFIKTAKVTYINYVNCSRCGKTKINYFS